MQSMIKNFYMQLARIFLLLIFILLIPSFCANAENNALTIYNRNEAATLSDELILKNDTYYISADDLDKINLECSISKKEDGDFNAKVFSTDAYGTENTLSVSAALQTLSVWDDSVGDYVERQYYSFKNSGSGKKLIAYSGGLQVNHVSLDNSEAVIIENSKYYFSLELIGKAISYEYTLSDNELRLWITDKDHAVLSGDIYLPENTVAPSEGLDVSILLRTEGVNPPFEHTLKTVTIPENENSVYFFAETKVLNEENKDLYAMFEFDGGYKTISASYKYSGRKTITASECVKTSFDVNLFLPVGMTAENDIYLNSVFEGGSSFFGAEPVIAKGENKGSFSVMLPEDYSGRVYFSNISGDERLFGYGYYENNELRLLAENADIVSAGDGEISAVLLSYHTISGIVQSELSHNEYVVRAYGLTDFDEKVLLKAKPDEDMGFTLKIPSSIYTYTLSISGKLGIPCGYVSNGVSSFTEPFYHFENSRDYNNIYIKYIPFSPQAPLSLTATASSGKVYLENLSDLDIKNLSVYAAFYDNNGKILNLTSYEIDSIPAYSDPQQYTFTYAKDFYKTDKLSFFALNKDLKPLSVSFAKIVNNVDLPEKDMMIFTIGEKKVIGWDKEDLLDNAPVSKNGIFYVASDALVMLDFNVENDNENGELYIKKEGERIGFELGSSELIYSSFDTAHCVYAPFKENDVIYVSIEDVANIFNINLNVYSDYFIVNNNFDDVLPGDKLYDAVTASYYKGILTGYEDGTFRPDEKVLRAEAAANICRLLGFWYTDYEFLCADVDGSNWAGSFIGICINEGIFTLEDNKFRPFEKITVNEFVDALKTISNKDELTDGIDTENLDRELTRGEEAQILYNFFK